MTISNDLWDIKARFRLVYFLPSCFLLCSVSERVDQCISQKGQPSQARHWWGHGRALRTLARTGQYGWFVEVPAQSQICTLTRSFFTVRWTSCILQSFAPWVVSEPILMERGKAGRLRASKRHA